MKDSLSNPDLGLHGGFANHIWITTGIKRSPSQARKIKTPFWSQESRDKRKARRK
jgi:hypothetical protein